MVITHCTFKEFKIRNKDITAFQLIAWEDLKLGTKSGESVYGNCDDMIVMDCAHYKDGIYKVYLSDRVPPRVVNYPRLKSEASKV